MDAQWWLDKLLFVIASGIGGLVWVVWNLNISVSKYITKLEGHIDQCEDRWLVIFKSIGIEYQPKNHNAQQRGSSNDE